MNPPRKCWHKIEKLPHHGRVGKLQRIVFCQQQLVAFSTHLLRTISSECCFNTLVNFCVTLHCKGRVFQKKNPPAGFLVLGHHQWASQSAHRSRTKSLSALSRPIVLLRGFVLLMNQNNLFCQTVFDAKQIKKDPGGNGCDCSQEGNKNQFCILSKQSCFLTNIVLRKKNERF